MSISDIEKNLMNYAKTKSLAALKVMEVEGKLSISKNFEQGGRPVKWAASRKLVRRPNSKTLIQRGNLRSISTRIDESGHRIILGLNPLSRAYGKIHNEGGKINHPGRKSKSGKRGKPYTIDMPRREFMIIPKEDYQRILNSVSKIYS